MVCLSKYKINYQNDPRYLPNFGDVRTVKYTCDVYTNHRYHKLCFPSVLSWNGKKLRFEFVTVTAFIAHYESQARVAYYLEKINYNCLVNTYFLKESTHVLTSLASPITM